MYALLVDYMPRNFDLLATEMTFIWLFGPTYSREAGPHSAEVGRVISLGTQVNN